MQTLGRAGIDASITTTNVQPALAAATDLLQALGLAATPLPPPPPPTATPSSNRTATSQTQHRLGPAAMWTRDDLRTALARRDIGAAYRILGRHGISQRRPAAATGQSQSEISEIVSGRQVVSYDVLARIADGLGVHREQLGLAADQHTAPAPDPPASTVGPVQLRLIPQHRSTPS